MQDIRKQNNIEQSDEQLNEKRWQAMQQRDAQADGSFYFGVSTTGIFCKPSCPSRPARRENVHFFDTPQQALQSGYRPCKRCQPLENNHHHLEAVLQACRSMQQAEQAPTLAALAEEAGLSPYHFQRIFKKLVGVSPRQYFVQLRNQRLQQHLREGQAVSAAIYNAGFGSNSRFYSQSSATLGMRAVEFRNGAQGQSITYAIRPCSLGQVLVAATEAGICAIHFGDSATELEAGLKRLFPQAHFNPEDERFTRQVQQVIDFIDEPTTELQLPLDIRGTAFQRRVWQELQHIRPGSTASYGEIAAKIGQPEAARAVANACAANSIAVAIPCHRVVRANGEPGGYRWGPERKKKLLEKEREKTRGEI